MTRIVALQAYAGAALIVAGVGMFSRPAAVVLAGLFVLADALGFLRRIR